jgi:hypothetical protein
MAIDQTAKRRKLAVQLTEQSAILMNTLTALEALAFQHDNGGPGGTAMTFEETDFTGVAGLAHIDVATINAVLAAVPTISTAFASPTNNFNKKFEAMRA